MRDRKGNVMTDSKTASLVARQVAVATTSVTGLVQCGLTWMGLVVDEE